MKQVFQFKILSGHHAEDENLLNELGAQGYSIVGMAVRPFGQVFPDGSGDNHSSLDVYMQRETTTLELELDEGGYADEEVDDGSDDGGAHEFELNADDDEIPY